ncbi:biotin--[acetyl-CoA-carboxylase] ligase [Roseivivax sediminis]|nr:biotin--[acetyl-CoA-carboxylase] ligase [Roseivivax sediminis]
MTWPPGHERRVLASVDSTMAEAARRSAVLAGPEWILAERQQAARGRRGRTWRMPEGNFGATLAMPVNGAAPVVALRSFVAALALFDTFVAVTGRAEPFALKWPNDVLLNGGKVAGILLETHQGGRVLAIGFGVNLVETPAPGEVEEGALAPVSLASETGAAVAPEVFLDHLAAAYARREADFRTYGFAPVREAWLAGAARLGQSITARTGTSETTGTFETVDPSGNLVILTSKGRVAIAAADVFF